MVHPRDRATEALERIRKKQASARHEPFRIVITGDPKRPVRAVVLPRTLPVVVAGAAIVLLLVTMVMSFTSFRLGTSVNELEGQVSRMVAAAGTVAAHPLPATVAPAATNAFRKPSGASGRFIIESVNTGEQVEVKLDLATGEVDPASYRSLRHLMRCQRTGAETPMDPRLAELLYRISQRTKQKILLVSGFRAPMFSAADLSYHTRGMAADIRIPGMTPLMVRELVVSMGVKGVGYYPVSQFVHVDVRDERSFWTDYGRDRSDGEGTAHGADPAAPQ